MPLFGLDEDYITQDAIWTIHADGSITTESLESKTNHSKISAEKIQFKSSYQNLDEIFDGDDNPLQFDVKKYGNHFWYTVYLKEPVPPKSKLTYKTKGRFDKWIYKNKNIWVYEKRHYPGPPCQYSEKISLPEGAKLVSVEPESAIQTIEGQMISLSFQETLNENEPFECRIKYTLSNQS